MNRRLFIGIAMLALHGLAGYSAGQAITIVPDPPMWFRLGILALLVAAIGGLVRLWRWLDPGVLPESICDEFRCALRWAIGR